MSKIKAIELLNELCNIDAISSDEGGVSRYLKDRLSSKVDSVEFDNIGSIALTKKGQSDLKIMIAGHMDEIGFIVRNIEDTGFLRLQPIGGWWAHVVLSQLMTVKTRDGKEYVGVVGCKAPHGLPPEVKNKVMDLKDIFLDIGASNKDMVEKLGIKVGDIVTPKSEFTVLADGRTLCGKAFDDRVGVGVLLQTLEHFSDNKHPNTIIGVGTVQEEVGLRGATTAANMVKPDIAIVIDVSLATDMPGDSQDLKCHDGVAISLMDASVLAHRGLLNYVTNLADDANIKYQYDMLVAGGTDGGAIHKSNNGVPTIVLSIPARYIHSHRGVISVDDYLSALELTKLICENFDKEAFEQINKYYQ